MRKQFLVIWTRENAQRMRTTVKVMNKPSSGEGGYLMEIPILLFMMILALTILIPHFSSLGRRILLGIAAVPILFALFYMIVIPGWMPSDKARLRPPWNWLVFLLVATPIVVAVLVIVLG
ncbi:MAG: hypothetical protein ACLQBD_18890 [Syntrophobacteraceae bacterium]